MAKTRRPPQQMELNLTSMMDIVFQLIIFFILVTNFAAARLPKIQLPEPTGSVAQDPGQINKVIINVVPEIDKATNKATGRAAFLVIDGNKHAANDYKAVTDLLKQKMAQSQDVQVSLRADKGLFFEAVQPVMRAVTQAGIAHLNLSARQSFD